MKVQYECRYASSPEEVKGFDTAELRRHFHVPGIFIKDQLKLVYSHYDRFIVGGAFPDKESIVLETIDPLKAKYFLERRELGIINVGGDGVVVVDKNEYELKHKEALYVGRGSEIVIFRSINPAQAAKFYLNSTPAHSTFPTTIVSKTNAEVVEIGSQANANHRVINKLIVNSVVTTCQLQMGMTELKSGSIWNTMPAHTHDRRMEVYFYFELPEEQAVSHYMGQSSETRHIWVTNEEAVISPPWSIHAGAGTSSYTFIWGMAGENLDYGDMDMCEISELR